MAKNGYFCIHCNNELSGNDRTMCAHCASKLPLVKILCSMEPPGYKEEFVSDCVYCVDGICANEGNPMYAEYCKGDLLCKRERSDNNG